LVVAEDYVLESILEHGLGLEVCTGEGEGERVGGIS